MGYLAKARQLGSRGDNRLDLLLAAEALKRIRDVLARDLCGNNGVNEGQKIMIGELRQNMRLKVRPFVDRVDVGFQTFSTCGDATFDFFARIALNVELGAGELVFRPEYDGV